jgi:hypothetical protein
MVDLMLLSPPLIDRMLRDERFYQFSFIKNPPRAAATVSAAKSRGCGGCGMRKRRVAAAKAAKVVKQGVIDYNAIKRTIAHIPAESQDVIKELLGCKQLKIRYADSSKCVQEVCI